MIQTGGQRHVSGVDIIATPCPKCGKPMFRIPCKCPFRRKGWATCAKCINPACAFQIGLEKATLIARRKTGGLDAISQKAFVPAQPQAKVSIPEDKPTDSPQSGENQEVDQKPIL